MNVLFIYMSVCSLVGLHLVISKVDDIQQHRNETESVRGWANVFGQISVEGILDANKTIPEFPIGSKHNYTQGANSNVTINFGNGRQQAGKRNNGSEGETGYLHRLSRNKTGIPVDLFFGWWSVVRPFGNEMVTRPKFPWMVAVQSKLGQSNSHLCSGNILTKLYVLSSCRCLSNPTGSAIIPLTPKDPSFISIVAGVSMLNIPLKEQLLYGQIRNAVGINIHPHCTLTQKFDYGVIELEYYLYYTNRVLPIPDPFETFRGKISEGNGGFPLMKESEICQAAGWPLKQTFWDGESKGEQKANDFMIMGKGSCLLGTTPRFGNQLICTKVVSGDDWMSVYGQSGDIGSGLVCHNRVTAILSRHSEDFAVFASLRPALSFLWQYYQDQNEIYMISSSPLPAISSILLIFAVRVPVTAIHL